jgi:hypothetical protein
MTSWPAIPFDAWRATKETLHRYTQIIGKIQLALTPFVNHFWNVTLRVTARGLATSALRYEGRSFDIELDFVEHCLIVRTSEGGYSQRKLGPLAIADFHRELFGMLAAFGIYVKIWDHPVELKSELIPFSQDRIHAAYDREYVGRFFQALSNASEVLEEFRSRFIGKCSGVGFYWGTFDVSVARYSGRRAPEPPSTNPMEREGYSHEVSEVGFWPGDAVYPAPAFFALHYPEPGEYARANVRPEEAHWEDQIHCFVLPYESAAKALEFFETTYESGARLAGWNRTDLER